MQATVMQANYVETSAGPVPADRYQQWQALASATAAQSGSGSQGLANGVLLHQQIQQHFQHQAREQPMYQVQAVQQGGPMLGGAPNPAWTKTTGANGLLHELLSEAVKTTLSAKPKVERKGTGPLASPAAGQQEQVQGASATWAAAAEHQDGPGGAPGQSQGGGVYGDSPGSGTDGGWDVVGEGEADGYAEGEDDGVVDEVDMLFGQVLTLQEKLSTLDSENGKLKRQLDQQKMLMQQMEQALLDQTSGGGAKVDAGDAPSTPEQQQPGAQGQSVGQSPVQQHAQTSPQVQAPQGQTQPYTLPQAYAQPQQQQQQQVQQVQQPTVAQPAQAAPAVNRSGSPSGSPTGASAIAAFGASAAAAPTAASAAAQSTYPAVGPVAAGASIPATAAATQDRWQASSAAPAVAPAPAPAPTLTPTNSWQPQQQQQQQQQQVYPGYYQQPSFAHHGAANHQATTPSRPAYAAPAAPYAWTPANSFGHGAAATTITVTYPPQTAPTYPPQATATYPPPAAYAAYPPAAYAYAQQHTGAAYAQQHTGAAYPQQHAATAYAHGYYGSPQQHAAPPAAQPAHASPAQHQHWPPAHPAAAAAGTPPRPATASQRVTPPSTPVQSWACQACTYEHTGKEALYLRCAICSALR